MKAIEAAVIPSLMMKIDGAGYTVTFPLSAIAQLEEKIQRPLRTPQAWLGLPAKDVQAVLEAGLSKHHADVQAAVSQAVCEGLNPEALDEVLYALAKLAFPRYMAELEARMEARKESPNA